MDIGVAPSGADTCISVAKVRIGWFAKAKHFSFGKFGSGDLAILLVPVVVGSRKQIARREIHASRLDITRQRTLRVDGCGPVSCVDDSAVFGVHASSYICDISVALPLSIHSSPAIDSDCADGASNQHDAVGDGHHAEISDAVGDGRCSERNSVFSF